MSDAVQDPTWCLHDSHVQTLLQLVVDHWADYWGVGRSTVPKPVEAGPVANVVFERARRLRDRRLRDSQWYDVCTFPTATDNAELEWAPERRLYAAVMRKAVLDWAALQCSPVKVDQRTALNCYWWFMGFRVLVPYAAGPGERKAIRAGNLKPFRLEARTSPFEALKIQPSDLWSGEALLGPYFPWYEPDQDSVECIRLMSLDVSAAVLGLNVDEMKKVIHLVSPMQQDKD